MRRSFPLALLSWLGVGAVIHQNIVHLRYQRLIPLNKTAPSDSVIIRAFEHNGSFRRFESMKLGSIKGSFEVEAAGFMSFPMRSMAPPQRAVLSLLR